MRLIGGAFLLYLGGRTFGAKQAEGAITTRERNVWRAYASTLFLTLTYPATILAFAAVFAGLGMVTGGRRLRLCGIAGRGRVSRFGVVVVSAQWWGELAPSEV